MSPSIGTLIHKFKNPVFEKVELEYQDDSTPIKISTLLVNQYSKSDVKDKFQDFQEWKVSFKQEAIDWDIEEKCRR